MGIQVEYLFAKHIRESLPIIKVDKEIQAEPFIISCEIQVERYRFESINEAQTDIIETKNVFIQSEKMGQDNEVQTDLDDQQQKSVSSEEQSIISLPIPPPASNIVTSSMIVSPSSALAKESKGFRKDVDSYEIFFHLVLLL